MKKVIYRLLFTVISCCGLIGCEELPEPECDVPDISSVTIKDVSTKYGCLYAYCNREIDNVRFLISKNEDMSGSQALTGCEREYSDSGGYVYFTCYDDFEPNTTYYYQFCLSSEYGDEKKSDVQSFTTKAKKIQTISWSGTIKDSYEVGETLILDPKSTSELMVSLSAEGTALFEIEDNKSVIVRGSGELKITASQEGNSEYEAADPLISKITVKGEGSVDGYEYVDLGLPSGIKWATCNVGASSPEGCGNYYAWGETTTKTSYMITNSKWLQISYSSLKEQGVIDDLGNLKPNHDAASVNCGENWRMPTLKEAAELHMCCKWIFLARNGIRGYMVVGPNGKAIYLPAAGWKVIDHLMDVSSHGYYWTSTADDYGYVSDKIQQNYSYYMEVFDNYGGTYRNTRSCGFTVRAVLGKW